MVITNSYKDNNLQYQILSIMIMILNINYNQILNYNNQHNHQFFQTKEILNLFQTIITYSQIHSNNHENNKYKSKHYPIINKPYIMIIQL